MVSMAPAISARSRRLMPATTGWGFGRHHAGGCRPGVARGLEGDVAALFAAAHVAGQSRMSTGRPAGSGRGVAKGLLSIMDTTLGPGPRRSRCNAVIGQHRDVADQVQITGCATVRWTCDFFR